MPNLLSTLNDQIRRLSRREVKAQTQTVRKVTAKYRRDIAALKREIASLTKVVKKLQKNEQKRSGTGAPEAGDTNGMRFRADGLKTHRAKLGISAADYGKLVGVSGLTIYNWEAKKSKPRRGQLGKIASVRGIGKREAMRRLGD